ncbi:hypothetical protein [Streptomyces sp. YU58]|uniref:hypothetical protein n=1 Tax=Streptomyces sp. SX92 TaxID=3158972 RepID=UPI0027B9A137|nr:hypothetical protein [Streptomyces coralus]WLW50039.1 hypothetical protein QU709_01120 [Streptomyces coralus]
MKWTSRRAAGLLTVGGVAAMLLAGPVATAQAGELTPQCGGGCPQGAPTAPDGFQVSSTTGALTTDGNYDPL